MLTLHGTLLNIIDRPSGTRKDGTTYAGYTQVQLAVEEQLEDGQRRHDILTMSCGDARAFRDLLNQAVSVPVRAYGRAGGVGYAISGNPS